MPMIDLDRVKQFISDTFPGHPLASLTDRGFWVQDENAPWRGSYIVDFTLDDGVRYFLKLQPTAAGQWCSAEERLRNDLQIISLLRKHDLPAPRILASDSTSDRLGCPFYLAEYQEGVKLCTLWLQVTEEEKHELFREMGQLFARMHAVHNTRSGLIHGDDPSQVFGAPNDFMLDAEIRNGSGKQALDQGYLTQANYDAMVAAWQGNLPYLNDHRPSLIHFGAYPWTIHFTRHDGRWSTSKLTSLNDCVMWWDPACNLALMQHPPFLRTDESYWRSFLEGYGRPVDGKRIALYALLTAVCAAMGAYLEPSYMRNPCLRQNLNAAVESLLARIR